MFKLTNAAQCIVLSGLWSFIVLQSVSVPFFLSRGLTMNDVLYIQAAFLTVCCLMEIPCGFFADRFGKRTAVVAASIFRVAGAATLVFSHSVTSFTVAYIFIAIGNALFSGTDISAIYQSSKDQKVITARFGALKMVNLISYAVSAILGGIIANWSLDAAAVANLLLASLTLPAALRVYTSDTLIETRIVKNVLPSLLDLPRVLIRHAKRSQMLLVILSLSFVSVCSGMSQYIFQAQWVDLGLEPTWFGIIIAGKAIASSVLTYRISNQRNPIQFTTGFSCALFLPPVAFAIAAFNNLACSIVAVFLLEVSLIFRFIHLSTQANHFIENSVRVSFNSFVSFLGSMAIATCSYLISHSGIDVTDSSFYLGAAIVTVAIAMLLHLARLIWKIPFQNQNSGN